jgi:anti-sigma B factor antagonist
LGNLGVRLEEGIFYLSGEFDMAEVASFVDATEPALDGADAVVLDLEGLTFIDSSGIRSIILLAKRCGRRGIVLRSLRPEVAKIVEIVRLGDLPGITVERPDRSSGGVRSDEEKPGDQAHP